ncbi:MAG: cytochrome c oxidase assembly protein [Rhodospirillales bacterium]|nr:cytochrome c oxidase assembly protein [Rhodospirillales bacterium]
MSSDDVRDDLRGLRVVRVRFDANVGDDAPLRFKASQPHMDVKVGETVMTFYEVTNTAPHRSG